MTYWSLSGYLTARGSLEAAEADLILAIDSALDFVDRCSSHSDFEKLLTDFSQLIASLGFKHFMMTGLPSYGEDVETLIVANHWPAEWTYHYRANRYFLDDPVSQWSFARSTPFTWADARSGTPETARTRQIKEDAKDMGMVDGMGFPMFDPNNWQAVVSLAADAPVTLTKKEAGVIYLASVMAQSQAVELSKTSRNAQHELTAREKDVLTWMAHGKSLWEAATILGISEATVKNHLAAIRTKLGATNTTHAVARGLRSRQIQL